MPIQCTCLTCGRVFFLKPSAIGQGGGVYCSRDCHHESKRRRVERQCTTCGTPLTVTPYQVRRGEGRYCGRACLALGQAADAGGRAAERFWARVNKQGPVPDYNPALGRCWLWMGYVSALGYGMFSANHRVVTAHKMAWMLAGRPPVPRGMDRDHLCRVRHCVNPAHLEAVSHAENVRRGIGTGLLTHGMCRRGHAATDANLYRMSRGGVACGQCIRDRRRAYYERLKANAES